MGKVIKNIKLSETLSLTECTDGYWLHDKTRGMNLAMRAPTSEAAFTKALTYYQDRLSQVEADYAGLERKVIEFVSQFSEEDDDEDEHP